MTSTHRTILLTGAGFSRNWGGWTADEAFEYLLGSNSVDDALRGMMWRCRQEGRNFEDILTELRNDYETKPYGQPEQNLRAMTNAILLMFAEMAYGYDRLEFERPDTHNDMRITNFLRCFDAIYTLNQDTLIEQKYSIRNVRGDYLHCYPPGLCRSSVIDLEGRRYQTYTPANPPYCLENKLQPYVKLHGSFNWFSGDSLHMLVMGGDKVAAIEQYPLLTWYKTLFAEDLQSNDCRLVVIGYSFRDQHINTAIEDGVARGLKIFVIDTCGADVVPQKIQSALLGASRRALLDTFSFDRVEHEKVMRFISAFRPTQLSEIV